MENCQKAEIENKIQDVMNRMVYLPENGQIEIPQDLLEEVKRRCAILLIRMGEVQNQNFMYLPENYIIDLNKFMQSLNEYYDRCEAIKTGPVKPRKHRYLFATYGIPTKEQLSRRELPDLPDSIDSLAEEFDAPTPSFTNLLYVAIGDIKRTSWNDFLIYDLTIVQTSNGKYKLKEAPFKQVPIVALRPYFINKKEGFNQRYFVGKKTIGDLGDSHKEVIEEYKADRASRISRFKSMMLREDKMSDSQERRTTPSVGEAQLGQLAQLTREVTWSCQEKENVGNLREKDGKWILVSNGDNEYSIDTTE